MGSWRFDEATAKGNTEGSSQLAQVSAAWKALGFSLLLLAAMAILPTFASAAECTDTWLPTEGSWKVALNWSAGRVPNSTDVACIGSGKTANVIESAAGQAGVVQGEGSLYIKGTSLELTNTTEASTINSLTMGASGVLTGPATLNISKSLNWTEESRMSGSGSTVILSGATATTTMSGSYAVLQHRRLVNEGTFTATSGLISAYEGAEIKNTGTFNANEDKFTTLESGAGGALFVNSGTLRKATGTGTSAIKMNFENTGTVDAQTGKLAFGSGGSGTSSGTWESSEGSEVQFTEGTFSLKGSSLAGSVTITGISTSVSADGVGGTASQITIASNASMSVSGSATTVGTVTMGGNAVITGAGTLKISKALNWNQESTMTGSGSTVIQPSASATTALSFYAQVKQRHLINEGTFTATKGILTGSENAEIRNTGTFNANEDVFPTIEGSSGALFVNVGTFQKIAGTGTSVITMNFENLGSIKESTGHLKFEHPIIVSQSEHVGKNCSAGDPVECATGNYSESQTDFAIGGRGVGLDLKRSYNAQAAAKATSPGAFGYGWTNSFGDHLTIEESGKKITVVRENGSTETFTESSGSFAAPTWSQDKLSGNAEKGYTLTLPEQTTYHFSGSGRLETVTDRNSNETTLAYDESGRLKTITDPAGRQITLTYNGEGLVESAKDPMGHVVKYSYEGQNLIKVTEPGETEPRWQFKYDGSHRMTSMTNGRSGATTNEYDSSSRVISQTDPAKRTLNFEYAPFHTKITNKATGAVTDEWFTSNNEPFSVTSGYGTASATTDSFSYNEAGQLVSVTDGNEHTTHYTYNAAGDRTSMTNAAEDETKWTYNETHDVLTETKPNGEKTTITRDSHGNPETIARPGPGETTQSTSYKYGSHGEVESVTDPREHTWHYAYDSQGDRTSATDPEGDKRTWGYNEDSQMTSMVNPRGNVEGAEPSKYTTTYEYSSQGDVTKIVDPLKGETALGYDRDRNITSITDPNGNKTTYVYDSADRLTEINRADTTVLKNSYDADGNLESQTDAAGKATKYTYDLLDRLTSVTDPLTRKTEYAYDGASNLKKVIDPLERTTTYGYDGANRLTSIKYSDGKTPEATFGYNKDGKLTSMADGTGESSFEYDVLDRLTKETQQSIAVSFGYDLANNETSIVYPGSHELTRAFDNANRLSSVTDWSSRKTSFGYDVDSNLTSITFPSGTTNADEYGYDRADQLSSSTMKKGETTLASLAYTRNAMGQVEKEEQTGLPGAASTTFGYTALNQVSSAGTSGYGYSNADNITKLAGVSSYEYDSANQLTSIPKEAPGGAATLSYNSLGERTELKPEGAATKYSYDQAGRLTGVGNETHAYGGDGLRLSTTIGEATQHFSWDRTTTVPLLLSDGSTDYIYGPGGTPLEQISAGGTPTYYHHDQLDSTRMLTNKSGEATGTFSYAPYGVLVGSTGTQTTPLSFAGQYTDPEGGLQYLRARYYDPATGQFISRDAMAALTRSPYGYANQDPLNYIDPEGNLSLHEVSGWVGDRIREAGNNIEHIAELNPFPIEPVPIHPFREAGNVAGCAAEHLLTPFGLPFNGDLNNSVPFAIGCAGGVAYAYTRLPEVVDVAPVPATLLSCLGGGLLGSEGIPTEALPPG